MFKTSFEIDREKNLLDTMDLPSPLCAKHCNLKILHDADNKNLTKCIVLTLMVMAQIVCLSGLPY